MMTPFEDALNQLAKAIPSEDAFNQRVFAEDSREFATRLAGLTQDEWLAWMSLRLLRRDPIDNLGGEQSKLPMVWFVGLSRKLSIDCASRIRECLNSLLTKAILCSRLFPGDYGKVCSIFDAAGILIPSSTGGINDIEAFVKRWLKTFEEKGTLHEADLERDPLYSACNLLVRWQDRLGHPFWSNVERSVIGDERTQPHDQRAFVFLLAEAYQQIGAKEFVLYLLRNWTKTPEFQSAAYPAMVVFVNDVVRRYKPERVSSRIDQLLTAVAKNGETPIGCVRSLKEQLAGIVARNVSPPPAPATAKPRWRVGNPGHAAKVPEERDQQLVGNP